MAAAQEEDARVAVVGFGLGGAVFHAPLVAATPGLRLASVVTSNADRRARAAREYSGIQVLDGVESLWELAAEHDLVVVTTPNRWHAPIALAALGAGLAVVVDKPFAPSVGEARRVVEAAAERGLLLSVFQNRRWDGDFLTVRRLLSEGAVGEVTRFESRYERWRPELDPSQWRERGAAEEAGGLLYDLGSHLVDQAIQLFGRPIRVYAEVERRRPGAEADDDAFLALTHAGGIRSHLWATHVAALTGPRFRLLGARGGFEKHGMDVQEEALAAGARPGDPGWGREAPERWGTLSTGDGSRPVETEPGAYERYYEGIAASLRAGDPPPVEPQDSVEVLEVLEAARESARSGTVVSV
ncbi:MAG TPA: Gfo/Idh/MocA family oxidoreductase [Actinomycetota bacterium]